MKIDRYITFLQQTTGRKSTWTPEGI